MPGPAPPRGQRPQILVAISVAVFVGGFAIVSVIVGADAIFEQLGRITPMVFGGLLVLSLLNYGARGWRWLLYSRRLGIDVPTGRNLIYFIAGFALTTTPGKVGEAVRLWLLERSHGHGYLRVMPLLFGDRMSDMSGVLLLALATAIGFPDQIWLTVAAGTTVLVASLAFAFPRTLLGMVTIAYRLSGRRRPQLFGRLRRLLRRTASLFSTRTCLLALVLSVLGWSAEGLAFAWLIAELGGQLPVSYAFFIFFFSMAVGALSMLPGGLGSMEATMLALLVTAGMPFEGAVAAVAVIRITTLWFGVGLGFVALMIALRGSRRHVNASALEMAAGR
jgi:uncharacterized protein (TIRG00374 family)